MKTVIILHKMTVEDEEASEFEGNYKYDQLACMQDSISTNEEPNLDFESFLMRYQGLCNIQLHNQLKEDLIEHLWNHLGTEAAEWPNLGLQLYQLFVFFCFPLFIFFGGLK